MTALPLVIAPDPVFKCKSAPVIEVDSVVRGVMDDMMDTIHAEHGIGIAAPMVGILKRIVVVDVTENGNQYKLYMANPEITEASEETQVYLEGSLCFPGISADVTRPKFIKLEYLDYDGRKQEMEAEGFLATVLQHEVDYLNGKTFLDYLSPLKRDTLLRKMAKFKKNYKPHVHSDSCNH